MKVVALLTGRGNNTLADKNILPVLGKPLLYYPANAGKRSKYIKEFYVSSDDHKILDIAGELGYKRIVRPQELAAPNAQHVDAITHALKKMKAEDGIEPDILVVLMANSATIKSGWIDKCLEIMMNDNEVSAMVPVYEDSDHHPFRAKSIGSDGYLNTFIDFKGQQISTNRQDLAPSYFLCHNFWVLNVKKSIFQEDGQKPWSFMGSKIKPYIVEKTIDVHDMEDLLKTEKWLRKKTN
ncbi:MAG: NTP transferase domain-containing protein [Candidatus Margulisbacteria bacterium]|nr:NTP transferase domain-containing protein [Candidatus Margulisiibacteriota bacterium]